MDNNTVQHLETAIQVLAAAATAPLADGHFLLPLPPTHILLYEGNTLNLSSQTSTSLFQNIVLSWLPSLQAKVETSICSWLIFTIVSKLVDGMPMWMSYSPSPLGGILCCLRLATLLAMLMVLIPECIKMPK